MQQESFLTKCFYDNLYAIVIGNVAKKRFSINNVKESLNFWTETLLLYLNNIFSINEEIVF
jgi:hypothetical protein